MFIAVEIVGSAVIVLRINRHGTGERSLRRDEVGERCVAGAPREVIGVLAPYKGERNHHAILPFAAAARVLDGRQYIPTIELKAESIEEVEMVKRSAEDWLARRYERFERRVRVLTQEMRVEQRRGLPPRNSGWFRSGHITIVRRHRYHERSAPSVTERRARSVSERRRAHQTESDAVLDESWRSPEPAAPGLILASPPRSG